MAVCPAQQSASQACSLSRASSTGVSVSGSDSSAAAAGGVTSVQVRPPSVVRASSLSLTPHLIQRSVHPVVGEVICGVSSQIGAGEMLVGTVTGAGTTPEQPATTTVASSTTPTMLMRNACLRLPGTFTYTTAADRVRLRRIWPAYFARPPVPGRAVARPMIAGLGHGRQHGPARGANVMKK